MAIDFKICIISLQFLTKIAHFRLKFGETEILADLLRHWQLNTVDLGSKRYRILNFKLLYRERIKILKSIARYALKMYYSRPVSGGSNLAGLSL
jgi:hypothetical protein